MRKHLLLFPMFLAMILVVVGAVASVNAAAGDNDASYLRGDADGDGRITVMDVTLVQRVTAEFEPDEDGSIAKRGDVNGGGLSIDDATCIQRYLAEYESSADIGEPVTEAASAQDSTAPTVQHYTPGPNELPFVPNRP